MPVSACTVCQIAMRCWPLGYLAVFGSLVGFSAYPWLLRHVQPALAASYVYVNPPVAEVSPHLF